MDEAGCDPALLLNTYRDFDRMNVLISGWRGIYTRYLRPVLRDTGADATILDIGCGAGDVCRRLAAWAKADGFAPCFVGADPDARAIEYATSQTNSPGTRFFCGTAEQLAERGETFTVVLSNHVLHHLSDSEVTGLCVASTRFAPRLVLHADIHRHPVAYATFPAIGACFPGTYILPDGLLSIRRSFTPTELRRVVPADGGNWHVETAFPFRLRLVWTP